MSVGRTRVAIQGGRRRSLLARLLVDANRVVSTDRLIEDLWSDDLPGQPLNTLQAGVSYLRSVLEPGRPARGQAAVLVSRQPGYLLMVGDGELDALRFEALLDEGRMALGAGHVKQAADRLDRALGEWRGPALVEFADQPWARIEATRLDDLRSIAMEDRFEAYLALGMHASVVPELEAAAAVHPLRERLRGHLMLALYRSGRQAEALRAYRELRAALAEELGIDPSLELVRLEEAILLHKPELEWQAPGRERVEVGRPPAPSAHNLPSPLSSFVGREAELATLRALLPSTRLLTLTGPGGVGKTRLALELGANVLDEHRDGVWFVELIAIADSAMVPHQVRVALGLGEESAGHPLETIVRHLSSRQALLVLDNCEHLVEACAALVEDLLRACPLLRIVATSRERLRVEGETAWAVPPLSLPQSDATSPGEALSRCDAALLFVQRAGAARGGRALSEADERAVLEICQRLDGIPLALELAAARSGVLSLSDIAQRLMDRFRLLTASKRSASAHQATLRATIDWSYESLSDQAAQLFTRLTVFAGSFSLSAAEEVCAGEGIAAQEVLDLIENLVDKSLLSTAASTGQSRYAMLETLRQYGTEKLRDQGDEALLQDRHLHWALALAEEAGSAIQGVDAKRWLDLLSEEHENLRSSLAWADQRGMHDLGLRMAVAVGTFWEMRGFLTEGRRWIARMLDYGAGADPLVTAQALARASRLAFCQFDPAAAERYATEALALAERIGDDREVANSLNALASVAVRRADLPQAERLFHRSLAAARDAADAFGTARALTNLGHLASLDNRFSEARRFLEEAIAIRRRLGNTAYIGRSLTFLAGLAYREGAIEKAGRLAKEAEVICRDVGDEIGLGSALFWYGMVYGIEDRDGPGDLYRESMLIAARVGQTAFLTCELQRLALMAFKKGELPRGVRLLGAAQAILGADTLVRLERQDERVEEELPGAAEEARSALGDGLFEALLKQGQGMSLEEAVRYALGAKPSAAATD